MVEASIALRGWTTYRQFYSSTTILYDEGTAGSPSISIHDASSSVTFLHVLQGRYTTFLQIASSGVHPAIGQVGTIPANAQSVRFFANGAISVSFGGQPLPVTALETTPNYTIYGADVSAFAGQTRELLFQPEYPAFLGYYNYGSSLDNIFFSPEPVPEPGTVALFTLGVLVLLGVRRIGTKAGYPR